MSRLPCSSAAVFARKFTKKWDRVVKYFREATLNHGFTTSWKTKKLPNSRGSCHCLRLLIYFDDVWIAWRSKWHGGNFLTPGYALLLLIRLITCKVTMGDSFVNKRPLTLEVYRGRSSKYEYNGWIDTIEEPLEILRVRFNSFDVFLQMAKWTFH